MGVSPNVTTWFYSLKQFNFWDDLVNWTTSLNNEPNPPFVHSVSYGSQGNYPSESYRIRLDQEFQKLGLRGISIIFASGDDGSGCQASSSDACSCQFFPSFPATSQYVTCVGATRFLNGNTGAEGAVQLFKSGGGFSWLFGPLSYQASDIQAYFNSGVKLPNSCSYNASGRGTPDVGALGDEHFQVVNGGQTISVGGTSASAPSFSAIITMLNDMRFNNGKGSLGFLNPWIYQSAANVAGAFYDVTIGDNEVAGCCGGGDQAGFQCTTGWDPVTGVGTPNFAVLSTII